MNTNIGMHIRRLIRRSSKAILNDEEETKISESLSRIQRATRHMKFQFKDYQ